MSDSLRLTHGLQHARPPCPSPTPGACSNSCPSSQWCHPTIVPFSSCLQSFPASGFPRSQLFTSGGQSIRVSASVLPMNIQDWFPLGWTGWVSLQSSGLSRVFSSTTVQNISSLAQLSSQSNSYIYTCCCCCCQVASVVSNSVRPHRQQPTRLLRPWDFPGKSTGVGCHCLLLCSVYPFPKGVRETLAWSETCVKIAESQLQLKEQLK